MIQYGQDKTYEYDKRGLFLFEFVLGQQYIQVSVEHTEHIDIGHMSRINVGIF